MAAVKALLREAVDSLTASGVENAENEAYWLMESLCGVTRARIICDGCLEIGEEAAGRFNQAVLLRAQGTPVQYLLGSWDFFGREFSVGEGVLIPRAETESLVEAALEYIPHEGKAKVIDLCAGSGCVGLSIAAERPCAEVFLLEKSEKAARFLNKNLKTLGLKNAFIIIGDIFDGPSQLTGSGFDVLVSNPPYIPSRDLASLQREVKREPSMALDGGADGLDFYRCIAEKWLESVKPGGLVALECAEDQTERIAEMLRFECGKIRIAVDYNNLPRNVFAEKL